MQASTVLLLLCVLLAMGCGHEVSAQSDFVQVNPTTDKWSARAEAALEFVYRTTAFRDGVNGGRTVTLTDYFMLYGGVSDMGPANDGQRPRVGIH